MRNIEDYKDELKKLAEKHKEERHQLIRKYIDETTPYKAGDIVEDYLGKAEVEKIIYRVDAFTGMPSCAYRCKNLTKKGTQNKREPIRTVYLSNILKYQKDEI